VNLLRDYKRKRPKGLSPEPRGGQATRGQNTFVIQRHDATRLHYDFRLEMDGVYKSWAVPKGPSLDPSVKRLAIQVEDHPMDYGSFEGTIPEGNYGAGEVILWDKGTYEAEGSETVQRQLANGELKIVLHGQKLSGGFVLIKIKSRSAKNEWLLIKHHDSEAKQNWEIENFNRSVKSGKPPGPPRHAKTSAPPSSAFATGVQKLKNATKAQLQGDLQPALAMTSEKPFSSESWLYEIKWDGIRALADIKEGHTVLISRSGRTVTQEYPEFEALAKSVRARKAVLDGEIVSLDEKGRSNFQALQARFGVENPSVQLQHDVPVTFYFFDVLFCDGYDLRRVPLLERKRLLESLIVPSEQIRISEHQIGKGVELFEAAKENGLEGIVAKQIESFYPSGRSSNWLKFKTVREIDAVVGGWTNPRGSRKYFGSLLVGLYEERALRFIGGVGTGFPTSIEKKLFQQLQNISTGRCPFEPTPKTREKAHWVTPMLVARVGYAEWTSDKHLRQPRYLGLQPDRKANESTFVKERLHPVQVISSVNERSISKASTSKEKVDDTEQYRTVVEALEQTGDGPLRIELGEHEVTLTHLDKIYFPKSGYTKRDVLSYYASVSPYLLPFLRDRALVLHRYPNGIAGSAFYQKDAGTTIPDWIRTVEIFSESKRKKIHYFVVDNLASLLYLANLGCIEQNPFSARIDNLERPDFMFVDLDPTEGTRFERVIQAAKVVGSVLNKAALKFYLKTSGATGMHIFVPIAPDYSYEQVRTFLEIVARLADDDSKNLLTRTFRVHDRPKNSIFVDVRQNSYAQSLASVFSLRPMEGAPVSTPVAWDELKPDLHPHDWNLKTVLNGLKSRANLWKDFWVSPQSLENAVESLEKDSKGSKAVRKSR
jgi:bifunctional non-homologous end joining protein LigD